MAKSTKPKPEAGIDAAAGSASQSPQDQTEADVTAAPATAEPPAPSTSPNAMIVVTGPKAGRWRIGKKFTSEPVTLALEDLSEAELDALMNDPALTVIDAAH